MRTNLVSALNWVHFSMAKLEGVTMASESLNPPQSSFGLDAIQNKTWGKENRKKTKRKLISYYPTDQRQIQEVNPHQLVSNTLFNVLIEVTNLSQSILSPPREASRIYLAKTIPAHENCVQHPT